MGLARSGLACANLLYDSGADVSITDNKDNQITRFNASSLKSNKIKVELGRHSQEFIEERDLVIISPGVANNAPPVVLADKLKIPVISEIEAAFILCPAKIIAVTGSNGKTTVTTLIGRLLESQGEKAFICGNIGNPFSAQVSNMRQRDYVSLEVSSFQLERIKRFKPKISLILNFSRNHLDRHKDMEEYLQAKKRIFMNQDEDDYLIINHDQPVLRQLSGQVRARVIYFEKSHGSNPNQAAVLAVASVLGIEKDKVFKIFEDFEGLEHRMEFVRRLNEVSFVNDSKATTAESAIWALENIKAPVILIAGGRDKGIDYSVVLAAAKSKVRRAILIGEAKERIGLAFKGTLATEEVRTLEQAVHRAFERANAGDCVLLSPMCSSYDMFSSYEERGEAFKRIVNNL